jgi:hypothetical protein
MARSLSKRLFVKVVPASVNNILAYKQGIVAAGKSVTGSLDDQQLGLSILGCAGDSIQKGIFAPAGVPGAEKHTPFTNQIFVENLFYSFQLMIPADKDPFPFIGAFFLQEFGDSDIFLGLRII